MKFGVFFLSQAPEGASPPQAVLRRELAQVRLAEELGFDSVWVAEHHGSSYCVVPDALTYVSHIAALTSRVRIGLGVGVLPLRNPLEFAERAVLVDILSGGRLDVGVGRGYSRTEFETYGQTLEDRRERFEEALDVVLRAWTEDGFDHQGRFWTLREVSIYPKPLQRPHPPVFIASSGTLETMAAIARRGLPVLYGDEFVTPLKIAQRFAEFRRLAAEAAREATEIESMLARSWVVQKVHLAATTRLARERVKPYLEWRYRKFASLLPSMSGPSLRAKVRKRIPALKPLLNAAESKTIDEITAEDLVQFDIFGTPDDCIERLHAFAAAGVQNVICSFSFGGMAEEKVHATMRLFAREVMPAFGRSAIAA